MAKFKTTQIVAFGFLCAIAVGTALLRLPFSAQKGNAISLLDSLFTATSATCVTGLIVKDTGSFFSPFGKTIIFLLMQMGGLGIMTFSTLFAIVLGRKITIKENIVIHRALGQQKVEGVKELTKYILLIALGVEIVGAAFLFFRWLQTENWPLHKTLINAVFHSVSAFCNAGLSFFPESFTKYARDPYINIIMMLLIFLGGIGFIVILDLPKFFAFGKPITRVSVQTKLALTVSFILITAGALFILFAEWNNALNGMPLKDRVLISLFQAITPRTAGFNTIDIGGLLPQTMLVMILFMFIGASPGSTGGGVKTCTFGVLLATMVSMMNNKDRVSVFRRSVPRPVVRRAVLVFLLALAWVFFATVIMLFTERGYLKGAGEGFIQILFEVTSAFGTVGLSTGVTPHLSALGKMLIIITMFVGRVGLLTVVLSIALREEKVMFTYPEERIMVG